MKIVLSIAKNLKTVPMNRYVYHTLVEMGHEVVVFDFSSQGIYSRLLKKLSRERFLGHLDRALLKLVEREKPDLFLTIFGFNHGQDVLRRVKEQGVPTACWWLNDPFQFERSMEKAACYDYYFTNSRGSVPLYAEKGVTNASFLPVGVYPPLHKKDPQLTKEYDICFAGDYKPVREEVLTAVASKYRLALFGPWRKKLPKDSPLASHIVSDSFFSPEEMVRIFNQSKIVLNIHTWLGKNEFGINPRIFEANGCGSLQISDFKEEIADFYQEDQEIVIYRSIDELMEKLDYYLANPEQREEIAQRGYQRAHRDDTYRQRMETLLQVCAGARNV
jgi:spore maturation protein CgeB